MGEVWRAEDTRLGRTVAIKVLPQSFVADVDATARLKREARTAAQLYHPSIATIHSIEQDGDHIFIVEEFVEGESLTSVIMRGGMSEAEICRIGRAVADALAEAHAKGIVHRDIKPDNVIVAGNRVKVLDFGIAKQVGIAGAPSANTPTAFVTQQGMILGTIHYMSPEQALGRTIDGRTDVFSKRRRAANGDTRRNNHDGAACRENRSITAAPKAEPVATPPVAAEVPASTTVAPKQSADADAIYATAMTELLRRDPQARQTLRRVLDQDPHYAKAHVRMGEIALFNREFEPATEELNLALADAGRLDAREQQVAHLALALASRNRFEVARLAAKSASAGPAIPTSRACTPPFPPCSPI